MFRKREAAKREARRERIGQYKAVRAQLGEEDYGSDSDLTGEEDVSDADLVPRFSLGNTSSNVRMMEEIDDLLQKLTFPRKDDPVRRRAVWLELLALTHVVFGLHWMDDFDDMELAEDMMRRLSRKWSEVLGNTDKVVRWWDGSKMIRLID
jgi:hypothetical protein